MQIIEVTHKTVSRLLKKSVEEYRMKGKHTYLKFTDGSAVCIRVLKPSWSSYVTLGKCDDVIGSKSFHDEQSVWQFIQNEDADKDEPFTSRTVAIYFDKVKYYYLSLIHI